MVYDHFYIKCVTKSKRLVFLLCVCVFVSKKIVKIYFFKLKFRLFTQKKKDKKKFIIIKKTPNSLLVYIPTLACIP